MNMPRFSAEASLYKLNKGYRKAALIAMANSQLIVPAQFGCDAFPWLPWCPKPPSNVTCQHTNTDTACPLGGVFGMWCKDNSRCSDGSTRSSGWYPCGICIGGDF